MELSLEVRLRETLARSTRPVAAKYGGSVAWPKAIVSGRRQNRVKSDGALFPPTPYPGTSLTGKIFLTTVRTVLRV